VVPEAMKFTLHLTLGDGPLCRMFPVIVKGTPSQSEAPKSFPGGVSELQNRSLALLSFRAKRETFATGGKISPRWRSSKSHC